MDQIEYTTLYAALAAVPDPRHARGKQLEWSLILGVIASALVCQQRSVAAIAQWVQQHHTLLITAFRPARQRVPSEATIRRALRDVDVRALEQHLLTSMPTPSPPVDSLRATPRGHAVDGKYVRGAGAHGHPLLLVSELTWYFATPPLPCDRPWHTHTTVTKAHGRLEQRTVTCTDDLDDYLTWPGVQQVLRRDCERTILRTGEVTVTTTYALTSLSTTAASAETLGQVWRGHWAIENRVHYVRDVTFGEDAHQMSSGSAPQALATLRNAIINRLRAGGWTNIAAALRHYANTLPEVFSFIGLSATLL